MMMMMMMINFLVSKYKNFARKYTIKVKFLLVFGDQIEIEIHILILDQYPIFAMIHFSKSKSPRPALDFYLVGEYNLIKTLFKK
jgi:hypothetical protein